MLRDALCALPGFATWPCDEINLIWKHGHLDFPYDGFGPERVGPHVREFVTGAFDVIARRYNANTVVEKTCANSLRVAYVRALLPKAKFVFIYRDGADAVASAIQRWTSPVNVTYTLRKLRYAPLTDVPVYAGRFLQNRLHQWFDPQRRLTAWGPMTARVAEAAASGNVPLAAARQWRECVEAALDQLPPDYVSISYEKFVRQPAKELRAVLTGLAVSADPGAVASAVRGVRADSIGHGRRVLERYDEREAVASEINPILTRLGYLRF